MKIAEEPKREGFGRAIRAMGTAAVGGAIGVTGAELLARKMNFFSDPLQYVGTFADRGFMPAAATQASEKIIASRRNAARIILPILSGAAVMLADRYRQRLNEEYGKTRGYQAKK